MSAPSGRFEALGEALAQAQDELRRAMPTDRAAVRASLLAATSDPPRRLGWITATSTLALVAGLFALVWFWRTDALTFELGPDGETGVAGAWIAAPVDADRTLRFSDGSTIGLRPHARARVAHLRSSGAHVVLESGGADVLIESSTARSWQIDAGPYRIQVTGTRFFVAWDPAAESFELQLHEGAVIVEGPQLDGMRSVEAGQLLRIAGGDGRVAAAVGDAPSVAAAPALDTSAPPTSADAAILAPVEPDAGRSDDGATAGQARRRVASPAVAVAPEDARASADWQALAGAGDYRAALAAAEAEGLASLCERLPSAELLRLADVARFARKPAHAITVLTAVRRRFPDTDAAATAAFERGRVALAGGSSGKDARDNAEAASWFETYLSERPRGALAREAMGRLMEALEAEGGSAARAAARRYLDRYPAGPHADQAHRLLDDGQ